MESYIDQISDALDGFNLKPENFKIYEDTIEICLKQIIISNMDNLFDNYTIIVNSGIIDNVIYSYIQSCLCNKMKEVNFRDEYSSKGKRYYNNSSNLQWNQRSVNILKVIMDLITSICESRQSFIEYFEQIIDRIGLIVKVIDDDYLFNHYMSTLSKLRNNEAKKINFKFKQKPNENFRKMSLIPSLSEIKSRRNLFLRPNLKSGAFNDVEHYLDINFRLLREDYVGSLRDGLIEYLTLNETKKSNLSNIMNIRVYKNVKILTSVTDNQSIIHQIKFEITNRMQKIRWETSKRLIDGSLLCFSNDNFKTAYFAIVFDRDADDLYEGKLLVKFDDWIAINNIINDYNNNFIMIETLAYFESYKHTLESLKSFNEQNFPFKNYIVYSLNETIDYPKYVKDKILVLYDFRPLIKNKSKIEIVKVKVGYFNEQRNVLIPNEKIKKYIFNDYFYSSIDLLNQKLWPTAELMGLDESQYRALKTALTQELVVIQGPPGTGKTYIGVEVIKMLLHNYDKINNNKIKNNQTWTPDYTNSPILIVCYTNHALDQLLILLSKFLNEGVDEIIRIGGRSKEDALNGCNLKNTRERAKLYRNIPKIINQNLYNQRLNLNNLILNINNYMDNLKKASQNILTFTEITKYCDLYLFNSLFDDDVMKFYDIKNLNSKFKNRIFMDWLGVGNLENNFNRNNLIDLINYLNDDNDQYDNNNNNNNSYDDLLIDAFENLNINEESDDELNSSNDEGCCSSDEGEFTQKRKTINDLKGDHVAEEAEILNDQRQIDDDFEKKSNIRRKFKEKKYKKNYNFNKSKDNNFNYEFLFKNRLKSRNKRKYDLLSDKYYEMTEDEVQLIYDLWQLNSIERVKFYKYLLNNYRYQLNKNLILMKQQYSLDEAEFNKIKNIESLYLLRKAKIIGMTTTGAAKNQKLLQMVKPKIILAEEAAEVFESHIITCLSESCEQLILIGDNEQLTPKPNLYKLEKDYNLNVSLFERLVNNKIPKVRLNLQHRMRPEISFLMKYFYDDLIDADSVKSYENINGIEKDIFFIQHENKEQCIEDSSSKSNIYEAEYLTRLCDYLLKQNYKPEQITILVAYGGQLFSVKNQIINLCDNNLKIHPDLKNIRVTPIDNYQGEENDIILLSLVRSNDFNSIGFLATSNRICVALSRAKKGFYVIADFNHLASNSKLWSNIVNDAKNQQIIGKTLNLVCQKHPQKITEINVPKDFDECVNGGCVEICNEKLECGHNCEYKCHVLDHNFFNCMKPCERLYKNCTLNHKCNKLCSDECDNCMFDVEKNFSKCGHKFITKCSINPNDVKCNTLVDIKLDCGHLKSVYCYLKQEYEEYLVDPLTNSKILSFIKDNYLKCETICDKLFDKCKHVTKLMCHQIELNDICKFKIPKLMPNCGHLFDVPCFEDPSNVLCRTQISVKLPSCSHMAVVDCCNNNRNYLMFYNCKEKKTDFLQCGHEITYECNNQDKIKCEIECDEFLSCGHKCTNKCGECKNNKHSICKIKCNKQLPCGHLCSLDCSIPCYICTEKCSIECPHGKCESKCFQICKPCDEPCSWSCQHNKNFKCYKPCYEYCKAPRCNIKCDKILKCKHNCISLCGELCICIECTNDVNLEKLKTYILLNNCKCIIDVSELDKHMMIEELRLKNSNGFPLCPKCHTNIFYSKRYANLVQIQHNKLFRAKLLHKFNEKSSKNRFFLITHQAFHLPIESQIKIDNYMNSIISNIQFGFIENRMRLFKFYFKILDNFNLSNKQEILNQCDYLKDIFHDLIEMPIEIPNKIADLLACRLISCYYYYAFSRTKRHLSVARKIENGIKMKFNFNNNYFLESCIPVIETDRSCGVKIIFLKNLFKPISEIYF